MKFARVLVFVLILMLGVSMVNAQAELGSPDNPILVYFVPSAEAQALISGGEVLAVALEEATGLSFEVSVPTSYAATIEAMCADPGRSIGFIPALGYVVGNNPLWNRSSRRCGAFWLAGVLGTVYCAS